MTLKEKIQLLQDRFNEIAFGYDDSGCFWHFQYGPRGAGGMMDGVGEKYEALDADDFEEAVDAFLRHLGVDQGAPSADPSAASQPVPPASQGHGTRRIIVISSGEFTGR
jgi:hypothetical protein